MAGYIGSKASVVSSGAEHKKTFTITGATTSLTGLNYTVGKVHVFQNGVRLVDGTDYTATNGTSITLTVAAQNGDNVVVISQASYQVALSGIDDQSNATAITIDSSENVMVGKTTSDSGATAGFEVNTSGRINATRDGSISGVFNRLTSDGDIVQFRKNGSNVGVIGTQGGDLVIGTGDTGIKTVDVVDAIVPYNTTTNSSRDAAIDLGYSTNRFKDLYLSGGVDFGGAVNSGGVVSSSNKLDDYEEGTWTPVFSGSTAAGTVSYSTQSGNYTKIGRSVHIKAHITLNSISGLTGTLKFTGLPFLPHTTANSGGRGIIQFSGVNYDPTTYNLVHCYVSVGSNAVQILGVRDSLGWVVFSNAHMTIGSGDTVSFDMIYTAV